MVMAMAIMVAAGVNDDDGGDRDRDRQKRERGEGNEAFSAVQSRGNNGGRRATKRRLPFFAIVIGVN